MQKLRTGQMPPKGLPGAARRSRWPSVTHWFDLQFARLDREMKPDPGRVTARRLNRVEYNNTIRDLLGVDFKPADDFPADDSGYGFDNIGDVLSLSPVLMEKYLAAAEKIARKAIVADPPPKPTARRIEHRRWPRKSNSAATFRRGNSSPWKATTFCEALVGGRRDALSDHALARRQADRRPFPITTEDEAARVRRDAAPCHGGRARLESHVCFTTIRAPMRSPIPTKPRRRTRRRSPAAIHIVDRFEINGPYNPHARPLTESHKRIFICGHAPGQHRSGVRAASSSPISRAAHTAVRSQPRRSTASPASSTWRSRMAIPSSRACAWRSKPSWSRRTSCSASRTIRDPNNPAQSHRLDDYELASRLSYFLWSSMPDDELFRLAGERKLRKPDVLDGAGAAHAARSEVRRARR